MRNIGNPDYGSDDGLHPHVNSPLAPTRPYFEEAPPAERRHLEERREAQRRRAYNERPEWTEADDKNLDDLLMVKREVKPGDWLNSLSSAERKLCPIATGVMDYFPDALALLAYHSKLGNDKHNPGQPLHWAREKSTDHRDCEARHLIGNQTRDPSDGTLHKVGKLWRAAADLQLEIEELHARGESPFAYGRKP